VRAFVAVRMSEQVENAVAKTSTSCGIRTTASDGSHAPTCTSAQFSARQWTRIACSTHPPDCAVGAGRRSRSKWPRRESAGSRTSNIRAHICRLHSVESGALAALAARLETVAAEHGFEREKAPMEWASDDRSRARRVNKDETRDALNAVGERNFGVSKIESITLYRSHLGPNAASYEALATSLFQSR